MQSTGVLTETLVRDLKAQDTLNQLCHTALAFLQEIVTNSHYSVDAYFDLVKPLLYQYSHHTRRERNRTSQRLSWLQVTVGPATFLTAEPPPPTKTQLKIASAAETSRQTFELADKLIARRKKLLEEYHTAARAGANKNLPSKTIDMAYDTLEAGEYKDLSPVAFVKEFVWFGNCLLNFYNAMPAVMTDSLREPLSQVFKWCWEALLDHYYFCNLVWQEVPRQEMRPSCQSWARLTHFEYNNLCYFQTHLAVGIVQLNNNELERLVLEDLPPCLAPPLLKSHRDGNGSYTEHY